MSTETPTITTPPAPAPPRVTESELLQALQAERDRNNRLEAQQQESTIRGALQAAVVASGRPLSATAADQLVTLLRPSVKLVSHEGQARVVGPDLLPIDQFVGRALTSPDYAHFQRASNPQGGSGGVSPTTQTPPQPGGYRAAEPTPPPGLNLGQTLAWMGEQGMIRQSADTTQARTDVTKKFGLTRQS